MAKRTSLLGRSRPSERLTREEIAVLDKMTLPPEPPAKPPGVHFQVLDPVALGEVLDRP